MHGTIYVKWGFSCFNTISAVTSYNVWETVSEGVSDWFLLAILIEI